MKKLVTIVSAVMMLLMLAACAPTIDYSAEDMEQIELGNKALGVIVEYFGGEYQKKVTEATEAGEDAPTSFALTLDDDKKVDTATIKAGTSVEFAYGEDGLTNLEIKGSVTDKFGGTEDQTVSVEYYSSADEKGPFKVNGKGYFPTFAFDVDFGA